MMRALKNVACFVGTLGIAVLATSGLVSADDPYKVNISPLPQVNTGPGEIAAVLRVVFGVMGTISLLMVTIGGFRYVASQGDPQAAAKAKGTITYALIGLVVAVLAVTIVTFVIGRTT